MTVLDTNVFIDHFRGLQVATADIQSLAVTQHTTTDLTVMELYKEAANQQDEHGTIDQFLTRNLRCLGSCIEYAVPDYGIQLDGQARFCTCWPIKIGV